MSRLDTVRNYFNPTRGNTNLYALTEENAGLLASEDMGSQFARYIKSNETVASATDIISTVGNRIANVAEDAQAFRNAPANAFFGEEEIAASEISSLLGQVTKGGAEAAGALSKLSKYAARGVLGALVTFAIDEGSDYLDKGFDSMDAKTLAEYNATKTSLMPDFKTEEEFQESRKSTDFAFAKGVRDGLWRPIKGVWDGAGELTDFAATVLGFGTLSGQSYLESLTNSEVKFGNMILKDFTFGQYKPEELSADTVNKSGKWLSQLQNQALAKAGYDPTNYKNISSISKEQFNNYLATGSFDSSNIPETQVNIPIPTVERELSYLHIPHSFPDASQQTRRRKKKKSNVFSY